MTILLPAVVGDHCDSFLSPKRFEETECISEEKSSEINDTFQSHREDESSCNEDEYAKLLSEDDDKVISDAKEVIGEREVADYENSGDEDDNEVAHEEVENDQEKEDDEDDKETDEEVDEKEADEQLKDDVDENDANEEIEEDEDKEVDGEIDEEKEKGADEEIDEDIDEEGANEEIDEDDDKAVDGEIDEYVKEKS